jgi:hypothetical protein
MMMLIDQLGFELFTFLILMKLLQLLLPFHITDVNSRLDSLATLLGGEIIPHS